MRCQFEFRIQGNLMHKLHILDVLHNMRQLLHCDHFGGSATCARQHKANGPVMNMNIYRVVRFDSINLQINVK